MGDQVVDWLLQTIWTELGCMAGKSTWVMWDGAGVEGNREGEDHREPALYALSYSGTDSNSNLASLSF